MLGQLRSGCWSRPGRMVPAGRAQLRGPRSVKYRNSPYLRIRWRAKRPHCPLVSPSCRGARTDPSRPSLPTSPDLYRSVALTRPISPVPAGGASLPPATPRSAGRCVVDWPAATPRPSGSALTLGPTRKLGVEPSAGNTNRLQTAREQAQPSDWTVRLSLQGV